MNFQASGSSGFAAEGVRERGCIFGCGVKEQERPLAGSRRLQEVDAHPDLRLADSGTDFFHCSLPLPFRDRPGESTDGGGPGDRKEFPPFSVPVLLLSAKSNGGSRV